jgi:Protein of unknown function (DUF1592)/Protein of unknown function (DUF1588)/Protein of unknown function (DUF1587)/Protein of unknown function (DUF1595)/Protein of unknown function (DUF1585)
MPSGPRDPGRVTARRLNRAEYDNTVRDLLGTSQTFGATLFPDDAQQVGFDNNGDLQTISPVQFTLYQQAAESLAAETMTVGSAARTRLVTCDLATGAACKSSLVTNFGLRAFRRPLTSTEVTSFVNLMAAAATAGATLDEQFRTVVEAMLLSPNFLFRPELDADPISLTPHLLNPYEAASRLSYMIYRSMPDQALFDAAAGGKLAQPDEIQSHLQRMLADPKSTFAQTFASQWLGTTVVATQTFDPTLFPKFSPVLAKAMGQEITAYFNEFLQKNDSVSDLLTAKFSYLDNNLASLYGVPPVGTTMTRTVLSTPQRGGLLTMAGILAVTSYPTRTSVVKRGAWVLGQLLCAPPPAPPPDIPPFPEGPITAKTQKEILAQHRANLSCAICHDSMDNIGIAMENYDAMGAYRTTENGNMIDAGGKFSGPIALPKGGTGPTFTGTQELAATVAADPRFLPCVAQNVMTYALGRQLLATDKPYLTDITTAPQTGSLGVRDVLMNVVASDTFRMRRGDPTITTGAKP